MNMFKCNGNCQACGRCRNIFPSKVEKNMVFPNEFLKKLKENISPLQSQNQKRYGISFDVGTTTVAAALWDLNTNEKINSIGGVNPQRNFGADVLSRISFCYGSKKKHEMLRYPLLKTFENMTRELAAFKNISVDQIERCVFCGNTTMTLLLAGMSVDGLSQYPFTPDKTIEMDFDFFVDEHKIPSIILAGISGHIGGDITASMLASGMVYQNENSILLDLGTNGEVICKIDNHLYGFSTAAGPAFEGANISCGMSATVGAIAKFEITDDNIRYHLIGEDDNIWRSDNANEKDGDIVPIGICGTGLMYAISEMLKQNIINENGDLISWDEYKRKFPYSNIANHIGDQKLIVKNQNDSNIEISITQQDIRQLQMAKAAIFGGIKLLFKQLDIDINSIKTVYLAGGFSKIPSNILNNLNIFPFDISGKLKCIGNGALTGASMVLLSDKCRNESRKFSQRVTRIELGDNLDFQKEFLESFDFKI